MRHTEIEWQITIHSLLYCNKSGGARLKIKEIYVFTEYYKLVKFLAGGSQAHRTVQA